MTNSEVEKHYTDLKADAMAFANWLSNNSWNGIGEGIWSQYAEEPIALEDGGWFHDAIERTTEQLYMEFLKSV